MNYKLIVCNACLSTDRTLYPIKNIQRLRLNVDLFDLNLNHEGGVCWECKSIIIRFSRFIKQVELAQIALQQPEKLQGLQSLSTLSCVLTYNYAISYSEPLNSNTIDRQPEDIKPEKDNANDIPNYISDQNYHENPSIESDVYFEETESREKHPKEIKREVDDVNISKKNDGKSSKGSKLQTKDDEVKKEIVDAKENILEKEIRKERTKIKKKVKKPSRVKNKNKSVNTDDTVDFEDIKDKFIEVEYTEEEMVKSREDKRSHPNFKKLPYNCDSCVLGFTTKENHEFHIERKHDASIGSNVCPVCKVHFSSGTTLAKHVRKHYHSYRCKLCSYETSELWSALSHGRGKHSGDSEDRIHCRKCSYVAKTREDMAEHTKSQHSLICKECGEKFKGPNTLKTHKRRIHGSIREHKCATCGRGFRSRGRLEAHMATHGAAAAASLAYCLVCRVQYKNIYVYRNHLVNSANHSERRYHCEECGKKFASKVYYKRHYAFYHKKESNFKCELCDRLFISDWRLRHHRQLQHGAERVRNHACDQCGKKFYTASNLKAHQLTHSSQRTFMCADCGDTFKQRPALYTHTRLVHRRLKRHTHT